MRVESWVGMTAVLMMIVFVGAIAAEQQCRRRSPLPANVFLLHDIGEPIARIYEQAPSFRAQCERIAAAKWLRVTVRVDPHMPSRCRAFTILRRSGEQIEGLDLRTLSRVKGSGVREVEYAVFETARAQAAGEAVAAEAGRSARSPAAD